MENLLYTGVQLLLCLISFAIGKYILTGSNADKLTYMSKWTSKLVLLAKVLLSDKSGAEKNAEVTGWIREICKKQGIRLTEAQISALIEEAYASMKGGIKHQD